jgi:general stress protein YciG
MSTEDRGFASMDREKQREIASKGGKAAHRKGAAHEWTREEAQIAGRKGGLARHRKTPGAADLQSQSGPASDIAPASESSASS